MSMATSQIRSKFVLTISQVYCNKCYQKRKGDGKKPTVFPLSHGKKNTPICAVDGCDKEVAAKNNWVGVFL